MNTSNCSELYELNIQRDNEDEDYQARYINAILDCFPDVEAALVAAQKEGRDPVDVARFIAGEMSQSSDPGLELAILQKLVPITEKKQPVRADQHKDNLADVSADPVMMYKGQFIHNVDDIHISGAGIDFIFSRSYRNQTLFNGPLGYNWTHNFHVWLREGSSAVFLSTGDFREERYVKHPRYGETINKDFDYWMPPDGSHGVIFSENGSFVLRQPNGARQVFQVDPKHSFLHRLAKIEDRFGNYLALNYDPATDQLKDIEINHPDRYVQFAYDTQNRICTISDYTNRQWDYTYDSIGDLTAVNSPSTDRYESGLTVCYEYSSAFQTGNLQHNLTRIIDAAGQIYLETEYGSSLELQDYNRVTRQRQGGGQYQFKYTKIDQVFDIDYPDELRPTNQTTLIERNGQVIQHIYNKFGNLLKREQLILQDGLPRTLIEHFRYNLDARVISSLSPEGVFTQYLTGRDYFLRQHPLENGNVPTDSLTWQQRQTFGRTLALVRRNGYANFSSFTSTNGTWGAFPNIFNGDLPASLTNQGKDIIVKMTYELDFGQLLTVSDPRYTNSVDPEETNEHELYTKTLTHYHYEGPTKLLIKVQYPTPKLPNNIAGAVIEEKFTKPDPLDPSVNIPAYDDRGRIERTINAVGMITEFMYYDDPNEVSFGHLKQTIIDVGNLNVTVENEVDQLGRVTATHLPKSFIAQDGRYIIRSVYNELDQVIETTSTAPFNFKTVQFYDRTGKLERQESDLKDESGQTELGGYAVSTFCYDEEFNLVEATVGGLNLDEHLVTKHRYDRAGNKSISIDPNGNQIRIRYDERQLPIALTAGAGSEDATTLRTHYDGDGRTFRTLSARGNSSTVEFDAFGRIIAEVNALDHITRTSYDKASNVICERIFEKQDDSLYLLLARSETEYDELNRAYRSGANRFENPVGPFQLEQLDDAELASPGPGELLISTTFFDSKSRIVKSVDPLGREAHFKYDKLDRLSSAIDPLGNETLTQYDVHNNVVRTDQIDLVLAEDGTETGKRFFASSATYDELDRVVSRTDSLGNTGHMFYDSRDNAVRSIDPLANETHASFDVYNRPISSTSFLTQNGLGPVDASAMSVTTHQQYDKNSNLIAVIDALGRRTSYKYDALNRRRVLIYPDSSTMLSDYDVDSNVIRTQDNNGLQRLFMVDALNRTTHVEVDKTQLIGTQDIEGATYERYQYDGLNRPISAENDFAICSNHYNSLSWPLAETIQFTIPEAPIHTPFTTAHEFNDVGALIALTYPNGRRLELERDKLDRLTTIQNKENGTAYPGNAAAVDSRLIAKMDFAGQQRERCLFGNGASTHYRHDSAGRVIEIAYAGVSNPMSSIQYLYDAVSNIRIRNDVFPAGTRTERFAYDSLYRIAHEFKPDTVETFNLAPFFPAITQIASLIPDQQMAMTTLSGSLELPLMAKTYDYDLVGNRNIERLENGNDVTYVTNPLDQYDSRNGVNFDHDKNGNLINAVNNESKDYRYDSVNRLVSVNGTNNNELAHFGMMLWEEGYWSVQLATSRN